MFTTWRVNSEVTTTKQELSSAALHERVAALGPGLSASERRVAQYMARNPDTVAVSSAAQMAEATGTSDATVVRTAKALGYPGLRELKRSVVTTLARRRNPAQVLDDRVGRISHEPDGLDRVLGDSLEVIVQLRETLDRESWDRAIAAVMNARRVFVYGIGPAGAVAEMLAVNLSRIGIETVRHSATGFRLADSLLSLSGDDAVLVFAPLRFFNEIEVVLQHAREVTATSVVITEDLGLSLAEQADIILSTPQSATTAASENLAGLTLAHALVLSAANQTHDRAVRTLELLNQLRARVAGRQLDASPLTVPDA